MTPLDTNGLLQCPFCGSDDVRLNQVVSEGGWGVLCRSCHAYQDTRSDKATAIAVWNRRAPTATLPSEGLDWSEIIERLRSRPGEAITRTERLMNEAADALSQAQAALAGMKGERDEAYRDTNRVQAELDHVSAGIGSVRWMDPPDGGSVSLGEQVYRMRVDLEAAESEVKRLTEEKEGLVRDIASFVDANTDLLARIKALEGAQAAGIDHIETLSELLKIIREHWIDYDHVFSIAVDEADKFAGRLSLSQGEGE